MLVLCYNKEFLYYLWRQPERWLARILSLQYEDHNLMEERKEEGKTEHRHSHTGSTEGQSKTYLEKEFLQKEKAQAAKTKHLLNRDACVQAAWAGGCQRACWINHV